ncbi:prolyl-tRNA editing protein proX [Clostridia bacterium]|nr:prolyl-tRNA editing protein proX [Clostridia bacterium]
MKQKVYDLLDELNIAYEIVEHPPLHTQADGEKYDLKFDGTVCKNLFIRNKNKSAYYLVALPVDKKVDLAALQEVLSETKLSFGSEEALEKKLAIKSGAVSIFNVVNVGETDVQFIIDNDILESKRVGFHPNDNTATILLAPSEICRVLDNYKVGYKFIDIE